MLAALTRRLTNHGRAGGSTCRRADLEPERTAEERTTSWVPMIAIALGQVIMSFNVASLPVALGGMVESFDVPPTTVATGIVAYSMLVAGFVMLGAKLTQRFGALRVFRAAVVAVRRRAGADDVQPDRDADDHGAGAVRRGRLR